MSLMGLEESKRCDLVIAEFYTNKMPSLSVQRLEKLLGKTVTVLSRSQVEEDVMQQVLKHAAQKRVGFLVSGDPLAATTHVELRLQAEKNGIRTRLIHSSSVYTVAPAAVGLQIQKFGRTVSLPIPEGGGFPESAYDYITENKRLGLHTLILLENRPDGSFLPIPHALAALQEVSENRKDGMVNQDTLTIGLARLECDDTIIQGGRLSDLAHLNFGGPPHSIIVPGRLHFKEAEALEVFAHTPRTLLEAYM